MTPDRVIESSGFAMLDLQKAEEFLSNLAKARVASDVDALTAFFHDDGIFSIVGVGAPLSGKTAIRAGLQSLVDQFEFIEWRQVKVFVSGNDMAVRHQLKVRDRTTGKIAETETSEFLSLQDGRCTSFVQFADTALVFALGVPEKAAIAS